MAKKITYKVKETFAAETKTIDIEKYIKINNKKIADYIYNQAKAKLGLL